jgi:hypothetical protein
MSYPDVFDAEAVGTYSARAHAGGGYVWDEVLEYRVWCYPRHGAADLDAGNDYFHAFASAEEAIAFSQATKGARPPLALIQQREYIDEPEPGRYQHVRKERITEWPIEFLLRPRRNDETIRRFFAADAPANRLDILRGTAKP